MRFLLATQPRSGTHMVRAALRAHPSVVSWHDARTAMVEDPRALVRQMADGTGSDATTGVLVHALRPLSDPHEDWHTAWQEHWVSLRALQDRVVLLTRRNHLRRYLSRRNLYLPRIGVNWECERPRQVHPPPVRLTLGHYLADVDREADALNCIREWLSPYCHVVYEALCDDWPGTMRRIYDHLGLEWNDPQIATFRQETRAMRDIIANYDALIAEAEGMLPDPQAEEFIRHAKEDV